MTTTGLLVSPERLLDILDRQGSWTEEEYLSLTDHTTRLVEFTDGFLELLPIPTDYHQAIVQFLLYAFDGFLKPLGGKVRIAPLRLRVRKGGFRERGGPEVPRAAEGVPAARTLLTSIAPVRHLQNGQPGFPIAAAGA